ncbi:VanZ family protein [Thermotoga sp.]|uniref:VanZ family protein n=1 Tax=Thermotoga sp. TaxID=28240 RepID=UPI0025D12C91|nr:VanZ family protein [Thermotoga sp.]MCD6551188.1 VanZ family protein [Thermotoga sp.]
MKKALAVLILTLSWIGLVFYFSSQPSNISAEQSGAVYRFLKKLDNILDITQTEWYKGLRAFLIRWWFPNKNPTGEDLVRKSAHFGLYLVLGALFFCLGWLYSKRYVFSVLLGISLPTVIAVLDEYNQSFRNRGSSLYDVIIDMNGAISGMTASLIVILALRLISWLHNKTRGE